MRVRFSKTVTYEQNKPEDCRTYEAGKTYDLANDHAQRWIRRGVAEEVVKEAVKEPAAEEPKAKVASTGK